MQNIMNYETEKIKNREQYKLFTVPSHLYVGLSASWTCNIICAVSPRVPATDVL